MTRSIAAALALAALVAGRARADSVTLTFVGLRDGQLVTGVTIPEPDGTAWIVTTAPPAYVVGPGNAEYTGTPGLDFGGGWSIAHTRSGARDPIELDSIAVAIAYAEPDATAITLSGQASDTTATPPAGSPPWSWSVTSPNLYTRALGGFAGDTIAVGGTGLWQVPTIAIDFTPIASGGGRGSLPEPSSALLEVLGMAIVAAGDRRRGRPAHGETRPREHRAGRVATPGHEPRGGTAVV